MKKIIMGKTKLTAFIVSMCILTMQILSCISVLAEDELLCYEIFDISFEDTAGNGLNIAPENSGFLTRISFEENSYRDSEDCIVLAVYGENNALLSLNYMKSDFDTRKEYSVAFYIPKQSVKIDSVKAFIWPSLGNMQPLCEAAEVSRIVKPTITLSANDIDTSRSDADNKVLYFYPNGEYRNSIRYTLTNGAKYYVNGVDMGVFDNNALNTYIENNPEAEVKLQKEAAVGSLCSYTKYNAVMITTYETAVVDEIIQGSDGITIKFKDCSDGKSVAMDVYTNDNNYSHNFTLADDKINPSELKENDILTIAYQGTSFTNSSFYDVQVSRTTIEGRCVGMTSTGKEFYIGDTRYKTVNGMSMATPKMSTDYKVYLDCFGKIAYLEEI